VRLKTTHKHTRQGTRGKYSDTNRQTS